MGHPGTPPGGVLQERGHGKDPKPVPVPCCTPWGPAPFLIPPNRFRSPAQLPPPDVAGTQGGGLLSPQLLPASLAIAFGNVVRAQLFRDNLRPAAGDGSRPGAGWAAHTRAPTPGWVGAVLGTSPLPFCPLAPAQQLLEASVRERSPRSLGAIHQPPGKRRATPPR